MGETAPGSRLSDEDRALLERVARWLVQRRLSVPAILFIESAKPLNFLGSQLLFFFEPMVKAFLAAESYTRLAKIMEDRDNVEAFLRILEAAEEDEKKPRKEETTS